jgi:Flp pilus assembly protein TadD
LGLFVLLSLIVNGCLFFGGSSPEPDPRAGAPSAPGDEIAHVRDRASLEPNEPYWPYRLGVLLAARDSLGEAESALLSSLLADPVYAPALTFLGGLYYEQGRYAEGARLLDEAREDLEAMGKPVPAEVLEGLALCREALDDPVGAEEVFARAAESTGEGGPSVGVYLGLRGSDYGATAEPARRAAEEHPGSAVHRNNLGVATLQAGDPIRAREILREAHDLDPDLPGPLYNLALLEEFYLMDHEAGAEWFRRYWSLSQADPDNLRGVFLEEESTPAEPDGGQ